MEEEIIELGYRLPSIGRVPTTDDVLSAMESAVRRDYDSLAEKAITRDCSRLQENARLALQSLHTIQQIRSIMSPRSQDQCCETPHHPIKS